MYTIHIESHSNIINFHCVFLFITYIAYTVASLSINTNGPIINSVSIEKATFDIINNRNWIVKSLKKQGFISVWVCFSSHLRRDIAQLTVYG